MTIESFGFVEHFDYLKKCIPQPFIINCDAVRKIVIEHNGADRDCVIVTSHGKYTLTKQSLKKLVDALGVKVKLLSTVCDETDVIDLALPIVDKLFKCFADCFVFYSDMNDEFSIIDLNVNKDKGEEGTRYEDGPSPWKIDVNRHPSMFTCFADFNGKYCIENNDTDIKVKAEDIIPNGSQVSMSLFKQIGDSSLQPMLTFSGKFSNMSGFINICPVLYDEASDITIVFPLNYAKFEGASFSDLWKKVSHIHESTDLNDYISREISELSVSDDTPGVVKSFIQDILSDSDLNTNQPIRNILDESVTLAANMKPAKRKKFKRQLGSLIGWCLVAKHSCCEHCGRMTI